MGGKNWRDDAACRDEPMETFFSPDSVVRAKQICASCEVNSLCRAEAVSSGYDDGVWGGWTPEERRAGDDRPIRIMRPERRRRSDLVTPACRACDTGLGFPLGATPGNEPAAGVFVNRVDGDRQAIAVVREDIRLRPRIDGTCACPGCAEVVGRRVDGLIYFDENRVVLVDSRARQRRILAVS